MFSAGFGFECPEVCQMDGISSERSLQQLLLAWKESCIKT